MLDNALSLVSKHRRSGAYLDTNLLLVLAIGGYDQNRLETFKRTKEYGRAEYRLLSKIMNRCERRSTTPNILTEVDNLARQLPEREHKSIASHLRRLVADMFEIYHESSGHVGGADHERVGLTDAILIAQSKQHLIITADFPLASRIEKLGGNVINFSHLRGYAR